MEHQPWFQKSPSARRGTAPPVKEEAEAIGLDGNLAPLAGTSGPRWRARFKTTSQALNFLNSRAPHSRRVPVFVITASEGLAPIDHGLAEAIEKAGDTHVTERHWDTDHSYSGQRAELARQFCSGPRNLPR